MKNGNYKIFDLNFLTKNEKKGAKKIALTVNQKDYFFKNEDVDLMPEFGESQVSLKANSDSWLFGTLILKVFLEERSLGDLDWDNIRHGDLREVVYCLQQKGDVHEAVFDILPKLFAIYCKQRIRFEDIPIELLFLNTFLKNVRLKQSMTPKIIDNLRKLREERYILDNLYKKSESDSDKNSALSINEESKQNTFQDPLNAILSPKQKKAHSFNFKMPNSQKEEQNPNLLNPVPLIQQQNISRSVRNLPLETQQKLKTDDQMPKKPQQRRSKRFATTGFSASSMEPKVQNIGVMLLQAAHLKTKGNLLNKVLETGTGGSKPDYKKKVEENQNHVGIDLEVEEEKGKGKENKRRNLGGFDMSRYRGSNYMERKYGRKDRGKSEFRKKMEERRRQKEKKKKGGMFDFVLGMFGCCVAEDRTEDDFKA
jgi:hypothetical protein